MIVLPLFEHATQLNSQTPYEIEIHNELWRINLYMNTGISNWKISIITTTQLSFFAFISVGYTITDLQKHETL